MTLFARLRSAASAAARAYRAADTTRWPTWAQRRAPARQALAERYRDSMRGHFLSGTPVGATIVSTYVTSLISDGPSIRSAHPNRAMRRALENRWAAFYRKCDAEGLGDLPLVLGRGVAGLVTSGEAFLHLETTDRGELRLRLLSPEQIDPYMNRALPGGGQVVAGIEFDAAGNRVAFHVRENPDSLLMPMALPAVRVPASDVLHIFEPPFPGSVRGRSWLAPVAQTILELHKIQDSLAARTATAALFGGFVHGESGFEDAATRPPDSAELSLEPGVLRILPAGTDITFPTLPTTEGADALIKHLLRSIATAVGLPPFLLTGDFGEINYSSGKLGLEGFKRRVTAIRASLLGAQLLQPLWERLVTLEILSGRINAPDFATRSEDYFAIAVQWPAFASLEPLKETQANVVAVNNGFKSRAQVVAELGRDVSDVDGERASDTFAPDLTALTFTQETSNAA